MSFVFVRRDWPQGHGERLLLAAIIRRAAFDLALYRGATKLIPRRLWKDAHDWFMSDCEGYFMSFLNICTLLDQDPKEIRTKAMMLQRNDVKKFDMVEAHGRV